MVEATWFMASWPSVLLDPATDFFTAWVRTLGPAFKRTLPFVQGHDADGCLVQLSNIGQAVQLGNTPP